MVTRRAVLAMGAAFALVGCGGAGTRPAATQAVEQSLPMAPNAGWDAWVASFRPNALNRGISAATFDAAFAGAGFIPGVVERDRNQTEVTRTLEDYLALTANADRVAEGRAKLATYGTVLGQMAAQFGVEAHVVTAIWGVETRFGARRGAIPVISALSTLAFDGRRGEFFTSQLLAALSILQNGDISAARMTGSWAGAMGHTQFIPTSYLAYAVDFTGDGRRDVWADDPTDALASAAAYLANAGWRSGQPWGAEVRLPSGFNTGLVGSSRSGADWAGLGVMAAAGGALFDGSGTLILPQGGAGPAFLTYRNFGVIGRYNNAQTYQIAVGHLSDRLRGGGPLQGAFPADAQGLSLADRQALQQRLTAAGHDTQGTDGVIGRNTMAAISAYEAANGLPVTGTPTRALLDRLR